jgi:hypothetical protein
MLAAPGRAGDVKAIAKTSVPTWLESLPPGYFVASDCAYNLTEHLVALYSSFTHFLRTMTTLIFTCPKCISELKWPSGSW